MLSCINLKHTVIDYRKNACTPQRECIVQIADINSRVRIHTGDHSRIERWREGQKCNNNKKKNLKSPCTHS